VLVLLSDDSLVLLQNTEKVLRLSLQFVLRGTQVVREFLDVLVQGSKLIVFKDRKLFHFLDFTLCLLLLQLIALKQVHQGVNVV